MKDRCTICPFDYPSGGLQYSPYHADGQRGKNDVYSAKKTVQCFDCKGPVQFPSKCN